MICDFDGQVLCTRAPSTFDDQPQASQSTQGNPSNYVVSVSQSKKYLFSFMMKDPKVESMRSYKSLEERKAISRINQMSSQELRRCQQDRNDPAFFFAPNAFINVIDIMREQVIS